MGYFVYILRCRDGSLYTGITDDIKKRMRQHARGRGSKYVGSRLPFRLVHAEKALTRSDALKRELEIKSFRRWEKLALVRNCMAGAANSDGSTSSARSVH
jgi:putative endonuclease